MKLKWLRLQGFKSFADKTEIRFDQQIAGVVGPNGCGKSNIVDAIRWVMGEQSAKGLRGKEMTDVIFAGTPNRKPAGFAEVSMAFDNQDKSAAPPYTELSELVITRRLYRSGESEYLINNQNSRLKDITDLFLGTGSSAKAYSIVAQGKVDEVVLAKPEDRRTLIEEAAGVAKYKIRKAAAERKIKSTEDNLSRVNDILKELERNARSLERQVEKAEKFREIQRELRQTDERLISAKVYFLDQKASQNAEALLQAREALETSSAQLHQVETKMETSRLEALNHEKLSSADYESLMAKKEGLSKLQTESELAQQKIELLGNQIQERQKDIERLSSKYDDQEANKIQLVEEITRLRAQKESRDLELAEFKAKLSEAEQVLKSDLELLHLKEESLRELKAKELSSRQKLELLQADRVDLECERASVERELEEFETQSRLSHQELEKIRAELAQLKDAVLAEEERRQSLERKANETREGIQQLQEEISTLHQERAKGEERQEALLTLEEHQVGYEPGAILRKKATGESFLMDLVRFKKDYALAGQCVMADLGQVFFSEEKAQPGELRWKCLRVAETAPQFERSLFSWVESELSMPTEVERFLKSVEWVEEFSLESAHVQVKASGELWIPLGRSGVMESAGGLKVDQSPFARRGERERLSECLLENRHLVEARNEALESAQSALSQLAEETEGSRRKSAELRSSLEEFEIALRAELEADARLRSLIEQSKSRMQRLDEKITQVGEQLLEYRAAAEPIELMAEIDRLRTQVEARQREKETLDARWIEFRIETGALNEKLERLEERSVGLDMAQSEYKHNEGVYQQDIRNWTEEIARLESRRSELQDQQKFLGADLERLEKNLAVSRETLQRLNAELEESERSRKEKQGEKDQRQQQLKELELEQQDLKHQVEELSQILYERYQVELASLLEKVTKEDLEGLEDPEELEKLESNSKYLRERLHKFGDVNLVALQEFEQIKERLEFMHKQRDDLLQTLDHLQSIIDRINNITEFRFRETFKAINHNFQLLFPKLFGGGKAYMKLTDENNLLEAGVEIYAEPPGKKIQAMSLLSGGEKAMTSISLLFSLFAFRPSSFCILDEVDAPLDDINTRRYNEIIQEMAALSQFVVITHNKRTMEVAETLFGVTMQEPGCSRLVGVSLQEARSFSGTLATAS